MSQDVTAAAPPVAPRPPLGIPAGSVRALLTLTIFGTSMTQLILGRPVDQTLWLVTIVVLLYYFAARQGSHGADRAPQQRDAHVRPPLGLPRGTIRWVLFLGFAGTAAWLGWKWSVERVNPIDDAAFFPLLALTSFFVGVVVRSLLPAPRFHGFADAKAVLVLGCAASVVVIYLLRVEFEHVEHVKRATMSFIIFYYGSR